MQGQNMKKYLYLCMLFLSVCFFAHADDVTFKATAPEAVAVGDQFRLAYTVSTQNVKDFRAPNIKGFDVLMGPSRSQQSSVQIINGKTTSNSSITFTYILLATEEGTFTIPGATIKAEDNDIISNSVQIKVLPADKDGDRQQGAGSAGSTSSDATSISNSDLFITGSANKTKVYEQEAILLTYKIYTASDLRGFDNVKLPDFKGFHSQEVDIPNRSWDLEHYNGRNYRTTVYRQFVLFPQQTGQLTIEPARFDASIAKANQVTDPFDAFFNGRNAYVEVKKSIFTPKLTIDVSPLPSNKPEGYSGGVGEFNISSSINTTELKTNDAITLKLVISGTGNMKLLSTPQVKFPEDFEIYDPKTESNSQLTTSGLSGNQVIEYLAIPRNAGTYKIPAVTFSYFDVKSKSYKTLRTEDYELHVQKGEGNASQAISNYTNKETLKVLNEDIRYIRQNKVSLSPRGDYFYGSWRYWMSYLIPVLIFIVLFVIYRKRISENANVAQVKNRKANKVAVKRMKSAGKLLSLGSKDAFYDEVLRALWGYVSDKLNIPVSKLSKDNVEEELKNHGVESNEVKQFIDTLNDCEFARYAPGDAAQAMDKIYNSSLDIISKMENSIKR